MNKYLMTVSVLLFCTCCLLAQGSKIDNLKTYTKTANGRTVLVKEGTLLPSNESIIQKAPIMLNDELGTANQERFAKLIRVEKKSPTLAPPTVALLPIAEQINFLTQELELLRTTNAEKLRVEKLERLLELKKLQSAALTKQ